MKRYEFLCNDDVFCLTALLAELKATGKVVSIKYVDPYGEYAPVTFSVDQADEFMEYADGALEEFKIRAYDAECDDDSYFDDDSDHCLGAFYIVLGNGDYTTIGDYVGNDFCEAIADKVYAMAEAEELRTR